jgi:hypothetical protein
LCVLLSGLVGLRIDVEAGPPVFVCVGASDSLQERPAGPFGGVLSTQGDGSEVKLLLIRCS